MQAHLQDHEMSKKTLSNSEFSHNFQASQNKTALLMAAILYHLLCLRDAKDCIGLSIGHTKTSPTLFLRIPSINGIPRQTFFSKPGNFQLLIQALAQVPMRMGEQLLQTSGDFFQRAHPLPCHRLDPPPFQEI